jgi:hypothetical protein
VQTKSDLLDVQRRFLSALREPIFADSRARSELPPRAGNNSAAFLATASALLSPSATLQPSARLELYHRQYWYRLLDSLAEDFPVLRALLGDEAFWRLLEAYVEATPPTSFTLRHLGAGLADFIHDHPACTPMPVHAEDVVRLEYAVCASFEAGEEVPVESDQIGTHALTLQPHLRLLALRTPVARLWRQTMTVADCKARPPTEEPRFFAVVFRQSFHLFVEPLPRLAFAILDAVLQTRSLDGAMASVAAQPGLFRRRDVDGVRRVQRVQSWFSLWVARGWFCPAERASLSERKTP